MGAPRSSRHTHPFRRVVAGAALVAVLGAAGGCSQGSDDVAVPVPTTRVLTSEQLERSGGAATVFNDGAGAFEQPVPGLTSEQRRTFAVGNSLFNQNWVTAPASTTGRDGLGPIFNAASCSSCHFRDGRGQPPTALDDPVRGLLVRLSVMDGDEVVPHPELGDQFQDRAVRGVDPEGQVRVTTAEKPGTFDDGTAFSLAVPTYELVDPSGQVIEDVLLSPRVAPGVFGTGLLEGIPTEDIAAAEDPDDSDGDGISGRAHWVTDADGERVLGRFGWKAAVPTVEAQGSGAFNGDMGITSTLNRPSAAPNPTVASPRWTTKRWPPSPSTPGPWPFRLVVGCASRTPTGVRSCSSESAALRVTRRRSAPVPTQWMRFPNRPSAPTPTCCSTTWARPSLTTAKIAMPAAPNGAPLRCGGSGCSRR